MEWEYYSKGVCESRLCEELIRNREKRDPQMGCRSQLGGGTASLSPFRRSPQFHRGSLPPLLGRGINPRPATKPQLPPSRTSSVSSAGRLKLSRPLASYSSVMAPMIFAL